MALGIFLPLAETIRRVNQITNLKDIASWMDDYVMGIILIITAYRVLNEKKKSRAYLIGAWGICAAGIVLSFLGQFRYYQSPSGDPGIFSTTFVLVAKGMVMIYSFIGLFLSIKTREL